MKRVIDVKSLVIGVLATALFFTIIGAKSRNNANFDTITAKKVKIVNSEGKCVADLGSNVEGGGALGISNKEGKRVADLGSDVEGEGILDIYNKEGKRVADLGSAKEGGALDIFNKEGKVVVGLGSYKEGEGILNIFNKHGKRVATVQANKDSDGVIGLYDRYGDPGWGMTGKK